MNEEKLFTIGITAFREGRWLKECWESVVRQTSDDWKAILLLDGGADSETLRCFEEIEHARVSKVRFSTNCGPYRTRNQLLKRVETPWFYGVDADDRLPSRALERVADAIRRRPEAGFVYGDSLVFENGERGGTRRGTGIDPDQLAMDLTLTGQSPFRTSLFRRVGGFASELAWGGADWDFWISVIELGVPGVRAEGVIYERRLRAGNVGSSWRARRLEVARKIVARHPQFFSVKDRQRRCLARAAEIAARELRRTGEREAAGQHAKLALELGATNPTLAAIVEEFQMSGARYALRRLVRRLLSA